MKHGDPYLTPLDEKDTLDIPETITIDVPEIAEASTLEQPPTHSALKPLIWTLFNVLVFSLGWHLTLTLQSLLQANLILGALFAILLGLLLLFSLKELLSFFLGRRKISRLQKIRDLAEQLKHERNYGRANEFLALLQRHFAHTAHQQRLQQCIAGMPDYLNDQEILDHLNNEFFNVLDTQTKRLIHDQSAKVAVMVALSPLASIDMLLAVWRVTRMVNLISQNYGLTLSPLNRWQMLWHILKVTAVSGSSQLLVDQVIERVSLNTTGKAIAWATQGISVGIYAVRIGSIAVHELRPIPAAYENKHAVSAVIDAVLTRLKSKVKAK